MTLLDVAERGWLPDWLIRLGIRRLLADRLRQECGRGDASENTAAMVRCLENSPIALATQEANDQHYEVPAEFFERVLGPRLKYSCCLYQGEANTLAEAEVAMLALTCQRAELEDGMEVLDLGCGWGSLALWIAEHYRKSQVTALSNSTAQRHYLEARASRQGLHNLRVITADITEYAGSDTYDRVLSLEMFEHMRNYRELLARIAGWLRPAGKLFVHIFCHRNYGYTFDVDGPGSWMARHFFTDGLMPSFNLLSHFNQHLAIERSWHISGLHYARTCEDWLRNLDANRDALLSLFSRQGDWAQARAMLQRWRMFFMACAELFRYGDGREWFVAHYLFGPAISGKLGRTTAITPQVSTPLERESARPTSRLLT